MKLIIYILVLLAVLPSSHAQNCPHNLDFEAGNLNGWECFIGRTRVENGLNVLTLSPTAATTNYHEVTSKQGGNLLDKFGNFPTVCPNGGNYSIRLGNENSQSEAEGIGYTFTVPINLDTFTVTYYYAIVLQDPSHPAHEQPRFLVTAYDTQTGNIINCSSFDYISTGGIPGFQTSTVMANVVYKDWTPASLQFAGLQGKTVRLEFKTADCTRGGHFGYAYIDVASICSDILATAPYCKESNSVTLHAPYGFQSYTWYNENFTQILGNDRTLVLTPAPQINSKFKVDIIPYPGYGCRDTLQAIVKPYATPAMPIAADEIIICQYQKLTPLQAKGIAGNTLVWYWNTVPNGTETSPIPATDSIGEFEYFVAQRELFGCESLRKRILVKVIQSPKMKLTISDSCVFKNINFTAIPITSDITRYTWNINGQLFTNTPTVTKRYSAKTVLPITLIANNAGGCADTISTQFTIAHNTAFAVQDTIAVINQPVQLSATGESGTNYFWSPSTGLNSANIQNPIATLATEQVYNLNTISKEGCISNSTIKVKRYKGPDLYIADAFTPNNDGKNDVLKIFAVGIKQFLFMEIFDRYGKIIFRTTDTNKGWNGYANSRLVEAGTYIVYAKAIDIHGNTLEKKQTLLVIK